MRWGATVLALLLLLIPGGAGAAQLTSAVRLFGGWNDNVNNSEDDPESDANGTAGVQLLLESGREQPLRWRLGYNPTYDAFLSRSDLNQLRHVLNAQFDWRLDDATTLSGGGFFERMSLTNRRAAADDLTPDPGDPEVTSGDEDVDHGSASLSLTRALGPRWTGSLDISHELSRFEFDQRSDSDSTSGVGHLRYSLSSRQTVGAGLRFTHQIIQESSVDPELTTDYGTLFGSWSYQFHPLWSLQLRAGPTLIRTDDREPNFVADPVTTVPLAFNPEGESRNLSVEGCSSTGGVLFISAGCRTTDEYGPGGPDTSLFVDTLVQAVADPEELRQEGESDTLFADVALTRRGEQTSWLLSFRRSEGSSYGEAASTVANVLGTVFTWQPKQRWTFSWRGTLTQQESATDATSLAQVIVPVSSRPIVNGVQLDPAVPGNPAFGLDPNTAVRVGELRVVESDRAVDFSTLSLGFAASHQVTRRLSAVLSLSWRTQENGGDVETVRETDNFYAGLGVVYRFDPVPL